MGRGQTPRGFHSAPILPCTMLRVFFLFDPSAGARFVRCSGFPLATGAFAFKRHATEDRWHAFSRRVVITKSVDGGLIRRFVHITVLF